MSGRNDWPAMYVQDVECSQCKVRPGEECVGPGEGYHLSRFDRLDDALDGNALPEDNPPATTDRNERAGTS